MKAETGDDFMTTSTMTAALTAFRQYLLQEEREDGTIEKYLRDAGRFLGWISGEYPTDSAGWKEKAIQWKEHLCGEKYVAGFPGLSGSENQVSACSAEAVSPE